MIPSWNERYVFKEHNRIRLATIFRTHAHLDLIVWPNFLWIRGLTLQYMYCKYALSCNFHSYELHTSLSCRKRKAYHHLLPWWGSTNTTYIDRLESVIQWNLWVLFWKCIKKLRNNGGTKNLRHNAWLDRSVFQLLKTQVKAKKPMVEGNMGKFKS